MRRSYWFSVMLMVVGLAGGGLTMAPVARAATSPPTQPVDLAIVVRCANPSAGIDLTVPMRFTGTAPVTVVPGDAVTVTGRLSMTLPAGVRVVPVDTVIEVADQPIIIEQPVSGPQTVTAQVPMSLAPVAFGFSSRLDQPALTVRVWPSNALASCHATGDNPRVSIPAALPADGSLQWFDLVAPATCTDFDPNHGTFGASFQMHGLAPAGVAPGEQATLRYAYTGYVYGGGSSAIKLWVSGVQGATEVTLPVSNYLRNDLVLPPAGSEGAVTFGFGSQMFSGVIPIACPSVRSPQVVIPIDGRAPGTTTTTSTSTTIGHSPASSPLLRLLRLLICRLLRIC